MSKSIKVALILGAILIGIGLIIVLSAGFASGWHISEIEWESNVYTSESDAQITDIDLEFSAGTLKVEFYDGDVIRVEYPHNRRFTTTFSVSGGTLHIETTPIRWFGGIMWYDKIPQTKMYIPQNMILGLKLKINAGTVSFGAGTFGNVNVKLNAGSMSMEYVKCNKFDVEIGAGTLNAKHVVSNSFKADLSAGSLNVTALQCADIDLDLSAGSTKIGIVGKKSDYTIRTNVSAGSCNVSNQNGDSKRLTVDVSAGSVIVEFAEQ